MPEHQPQAAPGQQRVNIDLDGLVARYGRMVAQSALEAEAERQRADRAEQAVRELTARIEHLEDAEAAPDVRRAEPDED